MALSKVDLANQVENQLPQNLVANNLPFRNILINGDMSIAQRGTSSSGATTDTYYTCDRWRIRIGALGTWTISQSTDIPTGQGFSKSLKLDCTTADASPSASDYLFVAQRIEGQNLQYLKKGTSNAESVTLSFWVKCNKTGNGQVNIRDNDNDRIIGNTYTINSANTWEKKTITFDGDTTGALDNDNGESFDLNFWLDSGSDYTGGAVPTSWEARTQTDRNAGGTLSLGDNTANEWYITGVQLEAGTSASDFEFLPFDVQLNRCKRYFQKSMPYSVYSNSQYTAGYATVATSGAVQNQAYGLEYPVEFRATPTLTVYRIVDGTSGSMYGVAAASSVTASPVQAGAKQVGYFSMGTSADNFYNFNYRADAEL